MPAAKSAENQPYAHRISFGDLYILFTNFGQTACMGVATNVLFLCTGNSARSQLAEALLRHHAGDRFNVFSAGTHPKPVHPLTFRVLEEAKVNIEGLRSKDLQEFLGRQHFGYVVVVCSNAAAECPTVWPGVRNIVYLSFDDPAAFVGSEEEQFAKFREVRDEIEGWLLEWIPSVETAQLAVDDA